MSALSRLKFTFDAQAEFLGGSLSADQKQTQDAFGFKWANRSSYDSDAMKDTIRNWHIEKYCDGRPEQIQEWLGSSERKLILDAGCGVGLSGSVFFGEHLKQHDYLGVDISDSVEVARQRFSELNVPGDFLQADLNRLPFEDGVFDMIFSDGVLHHTDSTERAIVNLARKLKPDGRFLFYVYGKKLPIREFTDDYIRDQLKPLSDEEAWKTLEPLTKLGEALGKLNVELDVPEDFPILGLKKGKIDIQRFFYWHICKMYYRPTFSFDEMNHVNYDWFRPLNCHRHTPDQVRSYCASAELEIERLHVQESGITVVARKL